MQQAAGLVEAGVRVIDLAADFRVSDRALYERYYGAHPAPEFVARFTYALADVLGPELRGATALAAPGCFATAAQLALFPLKGAGVETFEPTFTFQGFRYVAVDGFPGTLTTDALRGIVVHSDMAQAGTFETSKPLVNQLQHNILWGQKGNFVDVPTDCPQRDERLGWMGDAGLSAEEAAAALDDLARALPGRAAQWYQSHGDRDEL